MANVLSRFRSMSIGLTDDRLRLMTEILPAMRVIKVNIFLYNCCLNAEIFHLDVLLGKKFCKIGSRC